MGRNAHVLRLALGRNADQTPDWPSLRDQYVALDRDSDEDPIIYHAVDPTSHATLERLFSEKGHMISRDARDLDRARCEAQNAVVSIALPPAEHHGRIITSDSAVGMLSGPNWVAVGRMMQTVDDLLLSWLISFRDRLSMLRSLNNTPFLSHSFALELRNLGVIETFTAGYLCRLVDYVLLGDPEKYRPHLLGWLCLQSGPHRRLFPTVAKHCISCSLHLVQASFILVANLQALHIGPMPTPENRFPWVTLIRSCSSQQLVSCAANVLLPAWLLCTLRLQARAFVQDILDQDFIHPCYPRYHLYPRPGWIPLNSEPLDFTEEVKESALTLEDDSLVASLKRFFTIQRAAARAASSWLLDSLQWRIKPGVLILKSVDAQSVETLSHLPVIFTANLLPVLYQQILLSSFNGLISRSMAWLFLAPGSPLRVQGGYVSADDLFPILPTLADFTPGLGLRTTINYMANVALTFVLQCGLSFALVGIKSAIALAMLRRNVAKMASKMNAPYITDPHGVD